MSPSPDIATRATVVALKAKSGKSTREVAFLTGLSVSTVNRIYSRAIQRGFDPDLVPIIIRDEFVKDGVRSGRPRQQTAEATEKALAKVRLDRYGREKTCADIAGELSLEGLSISATTIWRILRKAGLRKTKPTRKPGLTQKMRKERLEWCKAHAHWTLEDWKNVIWSDETSVILLHRRGSYRVWRTKDEAFVRSVIRERWKGSSEFMFWGCFSYDQKGPCHCWTPETAAEKRTAEEEIAKMNEALEPEARHQWELATAIDRLNLSRSQPGRKPQFRWNSRTGKLSRSRKGGIDWWRYQQVILLPKLIPFAKECQLTKPRTIVQEDKAPSYNHHIQQQVYDLHQVQRLVWCPNSPDLNIIEPAWPWMKRMTTKKGAPKSRREGIKAWIKAWDSLDQRTIQAWVERIPRHIQEVIKLEGGNEYKEGREKIL